jgi:hypothetical protein
VFWQAIFAYFVAIVLKKYGQKATANSNAKNR